MIHNCKCHHAFQDAKYGPGRRVFNVCASNTAGTVNLRCTVCNAETSVTTKAAKAETEAAMLAKKKG